MLKDLVIYQIKVVNMMLLGKACRKLDESFIFSINQYIDHVKSIKKYLL